MIGHLAAALDPDDLDRPTGELGLGREDVGGVRVAAQGQDGRMLQEQQLITDLARGTRVDEALLEGVGPRVVDPAEPARVQRPRVRRHGRTGIDEGGLHPRTIAGRPAPAIPRVRSGGVW